MLDVRDLRVAYTQSRRATLAIAELTFGVTEGEFVVIVGPSGCGKTTLLRVVAGLLPPTSGQVLLHGRPIAGPPKEMAMVFQDYGRALCAWRSALGNVGFALEALDLPRAEKVRLAREALRTVGLADFERHYPWELSGGMQQRLQIARALAYGPQMLLLDEPFGSLDALTRAGLEDELLAIWTASPKTILMV
ncbi:MAG: ATP-binding cassette domain-containing protein, partial [Chloroflexi bacterium]|nr:ATP-binding cassette domain-containing protein [Chloroflexota bacterium]